ncbi:response regulator [uncultured Hyphomonas sp.]|uniref:response regulator transcription factor n=1 Tax=uncultured Hyphomonas sp. TaxID=225298 RepID=UPI002AAAB83A|nr:response regulator [uncultured Hyphomonas sp.]
MSSFPLVAIVDDDEDVRQSLGTMFSTDNYRVCCYVSAESYLNADDDVRPDIIVTDLHMPGMSGLDLVRLLRKQGDDTPVVLITAYATPQTRAIASRHQVSAVVEKPFQPDDLLGLIARLACG